MTTFSESPKSSDPNYVKNPATNRYVKRSSTLGKKLLKDEINAKPMDLLISAFKDQFNLTDEQIKTAISTVADDLPPAFVSKWIELTKSPKSTKSSKSSKSADSNAESESDSNAESESDSNAESESEVEPASKNKKTKKSKRSKSTSPKPIRMSAYTVFCKINREKVKEKYPNADYKKVTKILAESWVKVKEFGEKPFVSLCYVDYQNMADEANSDFDQKLESYKASLVTPEHQTRNNIIEPKAPKKIRL